MAVAQPNSSYLGCNGLYCKRTPRSSSLAKAMSPVFASDLPLRFPQMRRILEES